MLAWMINPRTAVAFVLLCLLVMAGPALAQSQAGRQVARIGDFYLSVGLVLNRIWVFEFSENEPAAAEPWSFSPMLDPNQTAAAPAPAGPGAWQALDSKVTLAPGSGGLVVERRGETLFTIRPYAPEGQLAGLTFFDASYTHLYGLGADYRQSSLNLMGSHTLPGGPPGPDAASGRGPHGYSQTPIPIVYALGYGFKGSALFVDETRPLFWNFHDRPWLASVSGPLGPDKKFRFFVIPGDSFEELRQGFKALAGVPPVPPRSLFGVWVSGLDQEKDSDLSEHLRRLNDGISNFAGLLLRDQPGETHPFEIASTQRLQLMVEESPFLPTDSSRYADLPRENLVARGEGGPPLTFACGNRECAVLDYTSESAATLWHSLHRAPMISQGARLFRLADGVSRFGPDSWYQGPADSKLHSQYVWAGRFGLFWARGIVAGLNNQRSRQTPRLFLVSQAGGAGLAETGGGFFTSVSLFNAAAYAQARANLFLSGVDYYGADFESAVQERPREQFTSLYEAWLASIVLTDLPLVLPETMASQPGARMNFALRSQLQPYYEALAHRAHLEGQPVAAPLVYYFQDDPGARVRAGELMLGPHLLVGPVWEMGERVDLYLPRGRWFNFRTGELIEQVESGLTPMEYKFGGVLSPPVLARAGAIVPTRELVEPAGQPSFYQLVVKVFAGAGHAEFTWYEDDGETTDYLRGQLAAQRVTVDRRTAPDMDELRVTVRARSGAWSEAEPDRPLILDVYGFKAVGEVTLNGLPFNRFSRPEELATQEAGWASLRHGAIRFKAPPLAADKDHVLLIK